MKKLTADMVMVLKPHDERSLQCRCIHAKTLPSLKENQRVRLRNSFRLSRWRKIVSKKIAKYALAGALGLVAPLGGSLTASAQGTHSVATAGYVSASNPDPNFVGMSQDRSKGVIWYLNGGIPSVITSHGDNAAYLGFDPSTQKSYLNVGSQFHNFFTYKTGEGLARVDSLPDRLVKPRNIAGNIGIYGPQSGSQVASNDRNESGAAPATANPNSRGLAIPPPAAPGASPKIQKIGSDWQLAYADPKTGGQHTLKLKRPHLVGPKLTNGAVMTTDYNDAEWAKPEWQTGLGGFIADDAGKYRFVGGRPADWNNMGAGVAAVDIYPPLDQPAIELSGIVAVFARSHFLVKDLQSLQAGR